MRTLNASIMTVALLAGPAIGVAAQEDGQPTTTDELLAGMVTEEVEPGVLRVVNDGVRDIEYQVGGYPGAMVDVTPDGGVWLSGDEGRHGLFRLGEEPVFEDRGGWPPYREVAPDGSLWATDWILRPCGRRRRQRHLLVRWPGMDDAGDHHRPLW